MRIHPQIVATLHVIEHLRRSKKRERMIICFGESGIEKAWVENQNPLFHVEPKELLDKKKQ